MKDIPRVHFCAKQNCPPHENRLGLMSLAQTRCAHQRNRLASKEVIGLCLASSAMVLSKLTTNGVRDVYD
jgi:hypothetical protein